MLRSFALLVAITSSQYAQAVSIESIKEISKRVVSMPPQKDCQARQSCDLISVSLVEKKLKVLLPNEPAVYASSMTDIRFIVELSEPNAIERYGIVQFMKGCMYQSALNPDGSIDYSFHYVHKNFGQYRTIKYPTPIVDAEHDDPVVTSYEGYGRFDLYRWNTNASDLNAETAQWYHFSRPPHGTVFYADLVANTGLQPDTSKPTARNASLEFNTCLFKIDDLPQKSAPSGTGIDLKKAIWCATWDHRFGYNFKEQKIIAESAINPICLK